VTDKPTELLLVGTYTFFYEKLPIYAEQDGHNRLKICQELRTEPQFKVKEFQDRSFIPINYIPFL
jgi:hypothetical protein